MTRDEFADIMGEIDERLIESALDISQSETAEAAYERPHILRYIMGAAACVAVLVTAVFAVPYIKRMLPPHGAGSSSESDFIRGWGPETLVYSETEDLTVGKNVRICTAELDGITAELILHNIKKQAGTTMLVNKLTDFDYTDYVGAENIALYIHDDKGRRFIADSVTPHSYNDMELISVNCLFDDCVRLYKTDNSEYVLMLYADYNGDSGLVTSFDTDYKHSDLIASFYSVDLERQTRRDENGIYDASAWRAEINATKRIGDWQYGYQASKDFKYINGKFLDPLYGYEMYWNGNGKIIYLDDYIEEVSVPYYNEEFSVLPP